MATLLAVSNPSKNGDGSELAPYNMTQAIQAAKPGDTILMRGVFNEVVKIAGTYTANAPLTIAAHPDGAAIDGKFALPKAPANPPYTSPTGEVGHFGALVQITGKYISWSGVDIKNSLGRGISVSDTSDVELRDFTVDWSRNAGVNLHTADRVTCRNVRNFHAGCYYQEQRPPSKKYNWPVAFNVLFSKNVALYGCESSYNWGEGFALGRGTSDSQIINCTAANSMGIQIYLHRSEHSQAVGNLVYCDGSLFIANGIVINNEDNFPNAPVVNNMLVANNIAVGCRHSYAIWGNETSGVKSTGVRFLFNTSINSSESSLLIRTKGVSAPVFAGNLFYQNVDIGEIVELAGVPDGIVFDRNAWITPVAVPAAARSPRDVTGVELVNPNAKISYGKVDAANYRPTTLSGIGVVKGAPDVDYGGASRKLWTVGALESFTDVVDPPVDPVDQLVQLTIEANFSAEEATQLRALLKDRAFHVKLVD